MYNAEAILLEPTATPLPADALQQTHDEEKQRPIRCSLRQMSMSKEVSVLGQIALAAYRCRLQSTLPIAPGWRLQIRADGAAEWLEYIVRRTAKTYHWDLLVERA